MKSVVVIGGSGFASKLKGRQETAGGRGPRSGESHA